VAETDLSGRIMLTNARFRDMVGRSDEELRTLTVRDIIDPADAKRNAEFLGRLVNEGIAFEIETRYLRPDQSTLWVHNSVSALRDGLGRLHRLLSVSLEIGERKRAEVRTELLLGELDHRVKNILAVVSAVVTQTLKSSPNPEAFASAIEGRIAAIARAHGLLTEHGPRNETSLRQLISTELAPYNRVGRNVGIDGPEVRLTPKAGLSLAMVVHELASNAAKYGALSTPVGKLTVSWTVAEAVPNGFLKLVWLETGGPPIAAPPAQRGFGTTLIERTLSHEFDAEVDCAFLPTGFRCTVALPLTGEIGALQVAPGVREGEVP
jgi:two-component system CheB/CheR fusion protein